MSNPKDHETIWLEPAGAPDRCWSQNNEWGDEGVEYVRRDVAAAEQAEPATDARSGAVKAILELVQYHVTDDDDRASLTTAISTLEPAEPAPVARSGAVKVKPLEWAESTHGIFIAKTPVGAYEVGFDDGWWAQLDSASTWEWEPEQDPRSYDGPSAAQAAAQSDYERRILAALEPAEPATDAEPVKLPELPDDDSDFTPDLARKIIGKYQDYIHHMSTRPPERHLREVLKAAADRLERLAFAIPPPNAHTPELVSLAIGMRQAALAQGEKEQ